MTQHTLQPSQRELFTPEDEIRESLTQHDVVQGDVRESIATVLDAKRPYHDILNIDDHTYVVSIMRESVPGEIEGEKKIQKMKLIIKEGEKKIGVFILGIDRYKIETHQDISDTTAIYRLMSNLTFKYIQKTNRENRGPQFGGRHENITQFGYFKYCLGEELPKRLKKSIEQSILYFTPTDIESQK